MRQRMDLTGIWQFQPDPGAEGERLGYWQTDHDDRRWREVWAPGCFETATPHLADYEGVAWYRRSLLAPAEWQGRRVVLRFGGVHYHAAVWVNGQLVGRHDDGFLPFEMDVTNALHYGAQNVVSVRSDNIRRAGEAPGLERGWRTFGGLQRYVELIATDPLYLDGLRVVAEPTEAGGRLEVVAEAVNTRSAPGNVRVRATVVDSEGREMGAATSQEHAAPSGERVTMTLAALTPGVAPWSPSTPNLYRLRVELLDGEQVTDVRELRIGYRSIVAKQGRLWLNGQPIYLTGFNRHEDSPRAAMADDLTTAQRDLEAMQEAGANFVRLCHYPHHPGELDLCDELGLLAMVEIPLYWWRGLAAGEQACAATLAAAERQLAAVISRDCNHPSVIFWSVSNETDEEKPEVALGNHRLVELAKRLDPTRLAVHVSHRWREHPHFEADDVICVNAYPSLNRRGFGGETDYDLARSTAYWRDNLAALHARYPDKPILVTEFGYAAFEGVWGNGFGEDVQAQAIVAEFAGMDAPYVCGATIWCWADHAWPGNVFSYCHHLAISPYGIVTRERRQLAAYGVVQAMFLKRQGLALPEPPTGPVRGPAGDEVYMVRYTLDDLPAVQFPEGFGIRAMRPDEAGLWVDIQRDAEPYYEVEPDWFQEQFGSNMGALGWRCYLIVNSRGVAVGTISAWVTHNYHGEVWGQLHWLAVRPAYQRLGLARAASAWCLSQLARWHDRAVLGTQSVRIGAIRLYLEMGFRPDLNHPGARDAWLAIREKAGHPGLEDL